MRRSLRLSVTFSIARALDIGREAAADGFDFGQFGHRLDSATMRRLCAMATRGARFDIVAPRK